MKKLILFIILITLLSVSFINYIFLKKVHNQHRELIQEMQELREVRNKLELELKEIRENGIEIQIGLEDIFPDYEISKTEATITAYTKECGHPWADGITFTGNEAIPHYTVAVDPDFIPLGTLIYIEDLGFFKADDIGGGVKGWHVDIYVGEGSDARKEALELGKQTKNIIILL